MALKRQETSTLNWVQSSPTTDDELFGIINQELRFQNRNINLTAACNVLSEQVGLAMHPALHNIHAEGYAGHRYHQGQEFADAIEQLAIERAKRLFGAEHANVQPYRGTMANLAACVAAIPAGATLLGFAGDAGGHFTTGTAVHLTARLYNLETYTVTPGTFELDYDDIRRRAIATRAKLIFAGDTAYPGSWDWPRLAAIADETGAALVADISQTAGLVAAKLIPSPVPHADIVTMATYKTLGGPRAGLILCKRKWQKKVDRAVFPVCQDGTNIANIAGIAASLHEASQPWFVTRSQAILHNARKLAQELLVRDFHLICGGTTNHACLIDLSAEGISGKDAARTLAKVNIICNANQVPFDRGPPANPSGVRFGTVAVTALGACEADMTTIASFIQQGIRHKKLSTSLNALRKSVLELREYLESQRTLDNRAADDDWDVARNRSHL